MAQEDIQRPVQLPRPLLFASSAELESTALQARQLAQTVNEENTTMLESKSSASRATEDFTCQLQGVFLRLSVFPVKLEKQVL